MSPITFPQVALPAPIDLLSQALSTQGIAAIMITIRKATVEDRDIIVDNNMAMALETENKTLDQDIVRQGVTTVLSDSNKGMYYLAEIDGEIAGQLMITKEWSDWRNQEFWWIQSVYVPPKFRRKGVYSTLHRQVREWAEKSDSVCGLRLYVDRNNVAAQHTYESLGMTHAHYELYEEDWALTS